MDYSHQRKRGHKVMNTWCNDISLWVYKRWNHVPAGIYLLKVNNRNTRTRCEICSKLTIKTPERRLASFWCLYC